MKETFIGDIRDLGEGSTVLLSCWLTTRRRHGSVLFLDLADSTGTIQAIVSRKEAGPDLFDRARRTPLESSIKLEGIVQRNGKGMELSLKSLDVIAAAELHVDPQPRKVFDIHDPKLTDTLLRGRHLYLRNPRIMAILRFRHLVMQMIRDWFHAHGYMEITAPVLTPLPLYEDGTVISVDVKGDQVYLTQCVGFYLEAAVHAFERVYNMGPSFRGEESRSLRHLMEYWHIKGEAAFVTRADLMRIVESLIHDTVERVQAECGEIYETLGTTLHPDALRTPYERITYREALAFLEKQGRPVTFGKSLSTDDEQLLSREFSGPFWVVGIPRSIEPFPYVIDPDDPELTMTADLIASRGYGELLGIAEKIFDPVMLDERMREKGKDGNENYRWVRELRTTGCVPHGGFGMGVERFLRWLLNIQHVRDTMPFPRTFRRKIYP